MNSFEAISKQVSKADSAAGHLLIPMDVLQLKSLEIMASAPLGSNTQNQAQRHCLTLLRGHSLTASAAATDAMLFDGDAVGIESRDEDDGEAG